MPGLMRDGSISPHRREFGWGRLCRVKPCNSIFSAEVSSWQKRRPICSLSGLIDWKVDTIFGFPGDGINGIFESLRTRQDKIRFIQVRHEEAAAFAACGYAKLHREAGRLSARLLALAASTCSTDFMTPSAMANQCWPSPGTLFTI